MNGAYPATNKTKVSLIQADLNQDPNTDAVDAIVYTQKI